MYDLSPNKSFKSFPPSTCSCFRPIDCEIYINLNLKLGEEFWILHPLLLHSPFWWLSFLVLDPYIHISYLGHDLRSGYYRKCNP